MVQQKSHKVVFWKIGAGSEHRPGASAIQHFAIAGLVIGALRDDSTVTLAHDYWADAFSGAIDGLSKTRGRGCVSCIGIVLRAHCLPFGYVIAGASAKQQGEDGSRENSGHAFK